MLSEVVNGLGLRDDRVNAMKVPLAIIPAGTGNGLASSLRVDKPSDAIKAIIAGKTRPLDTLIVNTQNDGVKYGFLR
jgi:sphingosine kinase